MFEQGDFLDFDGTTLAVGYKYNDSLYMVCDPENPENEDHWLWLVIGTHSNFLLNREKFEELRNRVQAERN